MGCVLDGSAEKLSAGSVCVCVGGGYTSLSQCTHVYYTVQFDVRAKSVL